MDPRSRIFIFANMFPCPPRRRHGWPRWVQAWLHYQVCLCWREGDWWGLQQAHHCKHFFVSQTLKLAMWTISVLWFSMDKCLHVALSYACSICNVSSNFRRTTGRLADSLWHATRTCTLSSSPTPMSLAAPATFSAPWRWCSRLALEATYITLRARLRRCGRKPRACAPRGGPSACPTHPTVPSSSPHFYTHLPLKLSRNAGTNIACGSRPGPLPSLASPLEWGRADPPLASPSLEGLQPVQHREWSTTDAINSLLLSNKRWNVLSTSCLTYFPIQISFVRLNRHRKKFNTVTWTR